MPVSNQDDGLETAVNDAGEVDDSMGRENPLVARCLDYIARYKPDMDYLSQLREKLHKAYMQEPYGNELEGRSRVVMSDVADTIEWIMPSLMRIFYGGTDVVKITGQGPEDEEGAKLLNEKVNHDFSRGFNGYLLLYDWFKDALMEKMGVVKYWWEKEEDHKPKVYQGLNDLQTQALLSTSFQLDSHDTTQGEDGANSHDIKGREVRLVSRPMAEVLPPEEFIFDIKAKTIKSSEFAAHKKRVHQSKLISDYGVTQEEIDALPNDTESFTSDPTFYERFKDLGGISFYQDEVDKEWKIIHECYLCDYSSGKKQPKKVVLLGNHALKIEDNSYGHPPFCEITPIRIPHRAIGRSMAELVEDLQKLKTAFVRFIADNVYYQNNAQKVINPFRINLEDALNNNYPGGLWRTKQDVDPSTGVYPIPVAPLPSHVFGMVEKIDSWKENRTGVTKYNQGTDADTLNKTATGISAIMSASQQRVELIARNFAEGGVKDLFYAFAQMNIDFMENPDFIRLNQEWKLVDPRTIDVFFDVNVDVALGTGTKDQMVQHLLAMLDRLVTPPYVQARVFQPQNLYNLLKIVFENMGIKTTESILSPPPSPEQLAAEAQQQQQQQMQQQMAMQAQQQGQMPQGAPNGPPQMAPQGPA